MKGGENVYNPLKTAIRRKSMSRPMKELYELELLDGMKVLDFGCGHGVDVQELKKVGIEAYGYDKYNNQEYSSSVFKMQGKDFDIVTCFYVFNVIPSLDECKALLTQLKNVTKKNGEIYISVRSDIDAVKEEWEYDEEAKGYWTTTGTFQRFYNEEMIEEMFGQVEMVYSNSSLMLFRYK